MTGHLFVVHSRVEGIQYDAAVVPTAPAFHIRAYWADVLGLDAPTGATHLDAEHLRPDAWPRRGFARVPSAGKPGPRLPTWFLDVSPAAPTALMAHLQAMLQDIGSTQLAAGGGRAKPLLALPVIGVGGGGHGRHRGEVIRRMLESCQGFVQANEMDIVIAAANASDYAAFQHERKRSADFSGLDPEAHEHGRRLAQLAQSGDLALFIGAGVSMPAGLPSWWELLVRLGRQCGVDGTELASLDSPLDQAELVRKRLVEQHLSLKEAVSAEFAEITVPSLSHVQLAALNCREVVTTNFDSLYETAANAFAKPGNHVRVLPFDQRKPMHKWVLKMHGDLEHEGELILSRSDFVGYSAAHGPVGSIVQALMLTKHLLVVGTSLTDDNFLRLAYEVTNYLRPPGAANSTPADPMGTVLALKADKAKQRLWQGTFNVVGASSLPDADTEGLTEDAALDVRRTVGEARARDLSVLLDFVTMHAATDNYLLDPRYEALLAPRERTVALQARGLCHSLEDIASDDQGRSWGELIRLLQALGGTRRVGNVPS